MKSNQIILLLALLTLSFSVKLYAQDFNWQALNQQSNRLQGKLSGTIYYLPPEGNSQHFYQKGWPEGSILLEDGDVFENVRLRYLAYGDELIAYNSSLNQLFVVDKEKVAAFTVKLPKGKQEFIKLYFNGFLAGDRYFEKLYDGSRKLLAFRSINEVKTGIYNDNKGRRKHTVLKLTSTYYMYSDETGFRKIQPRRKSFLNLFPERKKEVRQIFRKNNFYNLNEQNMISIFTLLEEEGFFY